MDKKALNDLLDEYCLGLMPNEEFIEKVQQMHQEKVSELKQLEGAKIYGLFCKMVEQVPKHKRIGHWEDLKKLHEMGVIHEFSWVGVLDTNDQEEE